LIVTSDDPAIVYDDPFGGGVRSCEAESEIHIEDIINMHNTMDLVFVLIPPENFDIIILNKR